MTIIHIRSIVIIIIDDYIDYIWFFFVSKKFEFKIVLRNFIFKMKIQNIIIEFIRMNNVDENINKKIEKLFNEFDIQFEIIVFDNFHQNDVSKRTFRTIFNRMKICLYDFKFSKYLWKKTTFIVVYCKNINFIFSLDEKIWKANIEQYFHKYFIFHEIWHDQSSSFDHLHFFDIFCYTNKNNIKKLNNQNVKCRLFDYEVFNQYFLWDLQKHQILKSIHVIFDDFIHSSKIEKKKNDFDYIILNFNFISEIKTDYIALNDHNTIEKINEIEIFDEIESKTHAMNFEIEKKNRFEKISIEISINQFTFSMIFFVVFSTFFLSIRRRFARQIEFSSNNFFDKIQNSWNIRKKDEKHVDSRISRIFKNFVIKIRKARLNEYKISITWTKIQFHFDKNKFVEIAKKKFNHHIIKNIWRIMISSKNIKIIFDRWVFFIKRNVDEKIIRYKIRWVTKDFRQIKKIDYFEIFFAIVKLTIWKCFLTFVVKYNFEIYYVNIVIVFFEIELQQKQWIQQFENFEKHSNFVCFLNRVFYDFKQSFREWYDCLKKYLIFIDYNFLIIDQCIFIHKNDIILSIHVDDIFIIELQIEKINVFKIFFVKRFRIKNLKKMSFYLNVKITKNRKNKTI